jgi:hypothetical protein
MSRSRVAAATAALALLVACGGPPAPPPGATAPGPLTIGGAQGDPIGFLLEARDSLHLADSTVNQLVPLNLRLWRRNAAVQMSVDTIMRNARFDPRTMARDTTAMPADLRALLDPLFEQRRAQTAAARDTAYALLTPDQRDSARVLFERMMKRRRGPNTSPAGGMPPGRP